MLNDVIGIDQNKEDILELVDFLWNPKKYMEIGAKIPKGYLLVGPPGVGKSYIAKAISNEAQCHFIYRSGSSFEEVFVGVG